MREKLNKVSKYFYRPDQGIFVIRVIAGAIFVHHGWMKLDNLAQMEGFFTGMLHIPAFLFYATIFVEIAGGLMLILGVAARAAAAALTVVMLVAIFVAVAPSKGALAAEFEWLLAAVTFGLALSGSGRLRVTHLFEHDGK
jgi:putative oxidoreductase